MHYDGEEWVGISEFALILCPISMGKGVEGRLQPSTPHPHGLRTST